MSALINQVFKKKKNEKRKSEVFVAKSAHSLIILFPPLFVFLLGIWFLSFFFSSYFLIFVSLSFCYCISIISDFAKKDEKKTLLHKKLN